FLTKRKNWFGVKEKDIKDIADTTFEEPKFLSRTINVIKHQKKIFIFSIMTVVVGITSLIVFQLNLGIDFTSGSRIEIQSEASLTTEEIEESLAELDLEHKAIVLSGEDNNTAVTRYDTVLSENKITEIKQFYEEKYGIEPSVSVVSSIV